MNTISRKDNVIVSLKVHACGEKLNPSRAIWCLLARARKQRVKSTWIDFNFS